MIRTSHLPFLSTYDPPEEAEGSLDPLGLALLAGRLAEVLVPGYTERSRRPRFLTVLALGSRVLGRTRYAEGAYGLSEFKDGPPNIAFERLVLESFGNKGKKGEPGLIGIPGIGKAREAADARVRLKGNLYLKAPAAVGLWVAYKRLARDLEVLDDDGHLLENGYQLLKAWEEGIGKPGLASGSGSETERFLSELDMALDPLLGEGASSWKPQSVWSFIYENLRPDGLTAPEKKVLRALLVERNERRSEVFRAIMDEWGPVPGLSSEPEKMVLKALERRGRPGLQLHVRTILAYERVVVLLRRAFLCLLFAGSRREDGRIDAKAVIADSSIGEVFVSLPALLSDLLGPVMDLLEEDGEGKLARDALGWLKNGTLHSPESFLEALLDRHLATQRRKPPDGRRPWIEGDSSSRFVRSRYVEEEPPPEEEMFHPYLTSAVRRTISDLWGENR